MRSGVPAALLIALLTALPAASASAQGYSSDTMRSAGDELRPGQFTWFEQPQLIRASDAGQGALSIVVSIPAQRAYVYRGGQLIAVTTVSTGSAGHETPVGEFTILQKKTFHRSNLYSNAPMPYMQRLTWDGIALHAGHLPGYPASHGCIRLPAQFARELYELTEMGGVVSIVDTELFEPMPVPNRAPPAPVLIADARDLGGSAFDVVTMRDTPPPVLRVAPAGSWVTGPVKEIVQPIPRSGSR